MAENVADVVVAEFVLGLEVTFPSTVSTIIRTAGKLGLRSADAQERGVKATPCPLCGLYAPSSQPHIAR